MSKSLFEQYQEGSYSLPGGFELRMFEAYHHASENNRKRLKKAYPELFGVEISKLTATGQAYFPNDPSVGMFPFSYEFQIHRESIGDAESREWVRKEFQKLYEETEDSKCIITFDDETHDYCK
jgi:hypothetical protein